MFETLYLAVKKDIVILVILGIAAALMLWLAPGDPVT